MLFTVLLFALVLACAQAFGSAGRGLKFGSVVAQAGAPAVVAARTGATAVVAARTGATAVVAARTGATALWMGEVYFDNNCEARLKDPNGRCPGEPGYQQIVPPSKAEDSSFAAFQKAMAEKKKKASDALKK